MNNIVDLDRERELNALINKLGQLISVGSDLNERTFGYLNGEIAVMPDTEKTKTVSVRFPVELLKWIDSYARIAAVNRESRLTRNTVIIGFLESWKAVIEHQEKTVWGASHQEMIANLIEQARNAQPGPVD